MTDDRMMAEIRDANLSYLILAQSLIRRDRVQALYRLGVSEETADLIDQLSPAQMLKIAQGNMLICRFRFDDAMLWSLLSDHGGEPAQGQDRSAARLHAAILMSGKYQETLDEQP
ncbi:MAG: flagellar transcriptional regulator FlhD [Lautropia sp.]